MSKKLLIGAAMATAAMIGSAPAAPAAETPSIYAYNARYYFGEFERGMFSMDIDGSNIKQLWKDTYSYNEDGTVSAYSMTAGWMRNGRFCGIYSYWPNGMDRETVHYLERDITTGEVLKDELIKTPDGDYSNVWVSAAYCPVDDCVYGVGVSAAGTSFVVKKAPADNLAQAIAIGPATSLIYGMTYNEELGALIGVTGKSNEGITRLVQIDPATGQYTDIMSLSPTSSYNPQSGICWVPSLQRYVYDEISTDTGLEGSTLLALNPASQSSTTLASLERPYDFRFMITMNDEAVTSPWAPREAIGVQANFSELTGNFTFKLPTELENGDAINGNISYSVTIDGIEKLKGSGAPGSNITTDNVTLSKGYHLYRVVLAYNDNANVPTIMGLVAGTEQPLAPANINLTPTKLSWDAVTTGISGGTMGGVTYTAKINGTTVATDITDTSVDVSSFISTTGNMTAYTATVTATCNGATSIPGYSNKLVEGAPLSVPFTMAPTQAEVDICTTADVDGNGNTWSYEPANTEDNIPAAFLSGFDMRNACNDWLFTPKFAVSANAVYKASIDAILADESLKGGTIAMYVGKEPSVESMKVCIMPELLMTSDEEFQFTGQFTVDGELAGADVLYIALQATSTAGSRCPIFVRNFSVTKTDGLAVPAAVTGLKAERAEKGSTMVNVTFKLPTKNADGSEITASSVDATVSLAKILTKTVQTAPVKVSGAPGAEMTASIKADEWGNLITVTPSANGKDGVGANVVANLSNPLPGLVNNLTAKYSEDNCTVYLEWEAPTTDFEGNPAEPGQYYTYNVYQLNEDNQYQLQVENNPLNHAELNMSGTEELFGTEFAIAAVNNTGLAPHLQKIYCQIGKPLSLPMEDDLNGTSFRYEPLTPLNTSDVKVNINWGAPGKIGLGAAYEDASVGDVIAAIPTGNDATMRLSFPKFSTTGLDNVSLKFKMWTGANAAASSVWCQAYDMAAPELVENITMGKEGYNDVEITLPAKYVNKPWTWIFLDNKFATSAERMVLASYKFSGVSGIDEIAGAGEGAGNVFAARNSIIVKGFAGERAEIYTLDGSRMASVTLNGNTSVAAGKGIYLVRIAGRSYKVIVR